MNFVPVILVLAAVTQSGEPTDYKTAYERAMKGDKPLLVLVTAEWCPPCQKLKRTTIPRMINDKSFRNFNFATVDVDRDRKDALKLIGSGTIPQLIIYEKQGDSWKTRKLLGYNSPESVTAFLNETPAIRTASANALAVDQ